MTYVIAQPCVGVKDGACLEVCPVDAIHPGRPTGGAMSLDQLFIDPDACVCCHLCVDECPVGAIFAQEDLPAEWAHFAALNAAQFEPGK